MNSAETSNQAEENLQKFDRSFILQGDASDKSFWFL